jgi:hypothetical protein
MLAEKKFISNLNSIKEFEHGKELFRGGKATLINGLELGQGLENGNKGFSNKSIFSKMSKGFNNTNILSNMLKG